MGPESNQQLVARVVAWHNQHPLAHRIQPEQVHSIGVVSLPFAVDGALARPANAVPADTRTDSPVELSADSPADSPADVPTVGRAAAAAAGADPTTEAEPSRPPAVSEAAADAGAAAGGVDVTAAQRVGPHADVDTSEVPAAATVADGFDATIPLFQPPSWQAANAPAVDPRLALGAWWRPWRWWPFARGPLVALFSEDFIEPLRPKTIARWVARHGSFVRPLSSHDPERQVLLDARMQARHAALLPVPVHVLTAAIGLGDRRVRLLLAPGDNGAILGPRHWNRWRVGAGLAGALMVVAGSLAPWFWPAGSDGTDQAQWAPPAATAAASAPAVAAAPEPVTSSASAAAAADHEASAPASAASAPAAEAPTQLALADDPDPSAPVPAEPSAALERPVDVNPSLGSIEMLDIAPRLVGSATRRTRATRPAQTATAGRAPDEPAPQAVAGKDRPPARPSAPRSPDANDATPAYALVMRPTRTRAESEQLALRLRLVPGVGADGAQADLMQAGERWRAILFPFTSAARAERARQVLAGQGLAVEMIEF